MLHTAVEHIEVLAHTSRALRSSSFCNNSGFLQKNNNIDEKSRIVASLNEQASPQKHGLQDSHFRSTETDFSNLYARGESSSAFLQDFCKA